MHNLKERSFNEWLVIESQRGEKDAFNTLIKNWEQRYFLYALNRLKNREAAKDVTQECLISISKSLHKLSDPASYPKWSFRIVERRCVDWLRKTIREREFIQVQQELPEIPIHDGIEEKISVEQVLSKMDARLSTILRLYYLEALTIQEIAEVSDVPRGTVKSRLFYARKMMIKLLEIDHEQY
ncbi:MAG: RNA polymerase sigma factor [Gammaproteobacteria bacterium]|nr:RNA polymerase sigma factor [Gammaproteobacteria bacterium]MBL4728222.1 RNA polymerase sigma factor [Gammaproteobacteria bacterium]